MIKVFSDIENHRGCTEEYVVKFWLLKPDGYWEQKEVSYWVKNSRRAHRNVEGRWKEEYGLKGKLISVTYQ